MGWVKIEDRYPRHRKMLEAGESGIALDICGLCYCREHDTDGFVPDTALALLGPVKNPKRVAAVLVSVNRWERDDVRGGWWIHDYLEFNPSGVDPAAEARSDRARTAARARWDARSNAQASDEQDAGSNAQASMLGMPPSLPLPKNTSRAPNLHFDALVEIFGSVTTKAGGGMYAKAANDIKAAGGSPDEILERGNRMLQKDWKDATPMALAKHWDALATPIAPVAASHNGAPAGYWNRDFTKP